MWRLLLLIAAVLVFVLLVRGGLRRGRRDAKPPDAASGSRGAPEAGKPQPMVACAHCGVHLPRTDAVIAPSGAFCGEPHRVQHERAHGGR